MLIILVTRLEGLCWTFFVRLYFGSFAVSEFIGRAGRSMSRQRGGAIT